LGKQKYSGPIVRQVGREGEREGYHYPHYSQEKKTARQGKHTHYLSNIEGYCEEEATVEE